MSDVPPHNGVGIRDFFEAILKEQSRAISMAEVEREKAAHALRIELERARAEGDDRLRDHITNQISQLRGDLVSADKLESERVSKAMNAVESLRKETLLTAESDRRAVAKAEEAAREAVQAVARASEARSLESKERAKEHNGLIDRMGEQAQRAERNIALAQEKFATKADVQALRDVLSTQIAAHGKRLDTQEGHVQGGDKLTGKFYAALAAVGVVIGIIVVIANQYTV